MERQDLSIRQFADVCGVSHTEIGRRMKDLGITGAPKGRGKPTLLSPKDQDKIAKTLFQPAVEHSQHSVDVITGDLSVYQPKSLATQGTDASLHRTVQTQQLAQSVQTFKANQGSFRDALLSMAIEQGKQLGHEMHVAQIGAALREFSELQQNTGKGLGVVSDGS